MGRSLMLPLGFQDHAFLKMMKTETNARNRVRLLAMHHLQKGKQIKEVAEIVQHHWKTVQSWLRRFREDGFCGLFESPRSGRPRKVTPEAEQWLSDKITSLSEQKTSGYITGGEIQNMLSEKYGISCALKTIYNTLHRLNFSWITSRSMHPKTDSKTQEDYKKTSPIWLEN